MNVRDVKDIQGIFDYADFLKGDLMNEDRQHLDGASFKTADGQTQIDVSARVYEPGYEYFGPTVAVRENGHNVFFQDASNVGPYQNESYTQSQFDTLDKAKDYLMNKYAGVEFAPTKDQPMPIVHNEFPVKWDDPAYAASLNPPTRLVFEDQGTVQTKEGTTLHKMVLAYACDRNRIGDDEPVTNPYLVNRKDANGINHAVLLPDNLYNRLMGMANREGMDRSRWTGVIQADVVQMKDGSLTANLTDEAVRAHRVKTPVKMFDEAEHDAFIKNSLHESYRHPKKDQFTIVRPGELEQQRVKPDNTKEDHYHPMVAMMREWRPEPKVERAGKTQSPPSTVRLVYEELPYEDPNPSPTGERFHKVAFAIACDQKTPGVDAPLGNPYLTNRPKGDPQGSHGVLLSEEAYQRLVNATNKQGTEGTRWAGVVDAHLVRTESREHMVPDLSADAEKSGRLLMPTEPFDAEKHDEFVKQSLRQLSKYGQPGKAVAQRIYGEPREGRALPDIELVPSADTPEMQAGE